MSLGAGLMGYGAGNPQALQQGIAGLGQAFDPMEVYRLQALQAQMQEQQAAQAQREAQQRVIQSLQSGTPSAGAQPTASLMDGNTEGAQLAMGGTGPMGLTGLPGVSQADLLQGYPQLATSMLMKQFESPEIIEDVAGFKRYATGPRAGERVFPGVVKPGEKPKPSDISSFRKEYTANSKNFRAAKKGYEKVMQAAQSGTGADDVALVFGYMKTIDPQSTVRESEFATAEQTANMPQQVVNIYNRLLDPSAPRLDPRQRQNFVSAAGRQFLPELQSQLRLEQQFTDTARRTGYDPQNVITDFIGDEYRNNWQPQAGPGPDPATGGGGTNTSAANQPEGKIAVNQATGEKLIVRNGKWVPYDGQ